MTGKGSRSVGKGQEAGFLPLLALPLMMKVLRKDVTRGRNVVKRSGKRYNNMDHIDKHF